MNLQSGTTHADIAHAMDSDDADHTTAIATLVADLGYWPAPNATWYLDRDAWVLDVGEVHGHRGYPQQIRFGEPGRGCLDYCAEGISRMDAGNALEAAIEAHREDVRGDGAERAYVAVNGSFAMAAK